MTTPPPSLPDQILAALRRQETGAALSSGEHRWSGAEIAALSDHAAALLRDRGATPGGTLVWPETAVEQPGLLPARLAALRLGLRLVVGPPTEGPAVRLGPEDLVPPGGKLRPRSGLGSLPEAAGGAPAEEKRIRQLGNRLGSVRRVAVLAPLTGAGGDAALACWSTGGSVVHQPAAQSSPGTALRVLEQAQADAAVLTTPLLRDLPEHPALALADFGPLRRIVHDGATAADGNAAWRERGIDLIGIEAGPGDTTAPATAGDEGARLLAAAAAEVDADMAGLDLAAALSVIDRLGHTALLSMLNALSRRGLFPHPGAVHGVEEILQRAEVAQEHQPLIRRWLRVLEEHGLLRADEKGWRAIAAPETYADRAMARAWDGLERDWSATTGGNAGTIAYARRNAECLPELMAGRILAVHLLFPEGRADLARALYRESIAARYQHLAVRAVIRRIAAGWRGKRPLRLLEVGAGTGATTETLMPALAAASGGRAEYLFTDVSRYFLDQAASWLAAYPFARRGLYDIDRAPDGQGHAAGSFDVVIAGGALNAARDTDASVGWLRELLSPNGWLVLTEPTVEEVWVMASQAFMLAEARDGRRRSGTTFLSLPQWNAVLDSAGLRRSASLPRPGHPLDRLGHRVFVARNAPTEMVR
ncbi:class I SAM-dependent methyltransferase [Phaeospirillum tilakii]|uniref:Methyltransferase n=1 Tax=Phaeospirillum tilakii TaxID=741673 RepID=A0ABW5CD16_9PROT